MSILPVSSAPAAPVKKVTLARVARVAGVSPSAASAWANRQLYRPGGRPAVGLSAETCERLISACRQLGYEPVDRQLWAQVYPERTDTCFLLDRSVAEGVSNPYHGRILNGVIRAMRDSAGQVVFGQISETTDYLLGGDLLPKSLLEHRAGRVILSGNPNYSLLMRLAREGRPVAQLSQAVDVPGVICVVPDFRDAARQAVSHLIGLGHRHIALVAESYMRLERYNTREINAGALAAFGAAGLEPFGGEIVFNPAIDSEPGALERLWARRVRPTAVFCFNDHTAIRVLDQARRLGVSVPRELSVMGSNNEFRDPAIHQSLSTVHFPLEEIGERAVALLNQVILDGPGSVPPLTVLPVELRLRGSTAAPVPAAP